VRRNHGVGIRVNSNGLYERNRIYGNYQLGIGGSGTNIEVRYNEIAYNGIQVNYFWEGGGSKFAFTNGVNGHHNYVHHNYGSGLWSDINNDNTLYEYNTVEDNANNGIFHEISYDFIIRYNTVRRNGTDQQFPGWVEGAGIVVSNSGAGVVHDNTVADNWQQIMLFESARGTGDQGVWTTQNVTVRDNVITLASHLGSLSGRCGGIDTRGVPVLFNGTNVWQNNVHTLPNNGQNYFAWNNSEISDAAWQALGVTTGETIIRV
jgi:hypothetical protein